MDSDPSAPLVVRGRADDAQCDGVDVAMDANEPTGGERKPFRLECILEEAEENVLTRRFAKAAEHTGIIQAPDLRDCSKASRRSVAGDAPVGQLQHEGEVTIVGGGSSDQISSIVKKRETKKISMEQQGGNHPTHAMDESPYDELGSDIHPDLHSSDEESDVAWGGDLSIDSDESRTMSARLAVAMRSRLCGLEPHDYYQAMNRMGTIYTETELEDPWWLSDPSEREVCWWMCSETEPDDDVGPPLAQCFREGAEAMALQRILGSLYLDVGTLVVEELSFLRDFLEVLPYRNLQPATAPTRRLLGFHASISSCDDLAAISERVCGAHAPTDKFLEDYTWFRQELGTLNDGESGKPWGCPCQFQLF